MGDDPRPSHPYRAPIEFVIEQQRIDQDGTPRDALTHLREFRSYIDRTGGLMATRQEISNLIAMLAMERDEVRSKISPIGEHANWVSGALGGGGVVVVLARLPYGWFWVALFLAAAAYSRYHFSRAQRWLEVVAEISAAIADLRAALPKALHGELTPELLDEVATELRERQERARKATNVRVDSDGPPDEVERESPPPVLEKKGNKP